MANENPFQATWTAQGHLLCLGEWQIHYQGLPLSLPENRKAKDMGTHGNFSWLFPDEDEFIEGTPMEAWIVENMDWLFDLFQNHQIPQQPQYFEWFYQAVNTQDWRCSSCGGCI